MMLRTGVLETSVTLVQFKLFSGWDSPGFSEEHENLTGTVGIGVRLSWPRSIRLQTAQLHPHDADIVIKRLSASKLPNLQEHLVE